MFMQKNSIVVIEYTLTVLIITIMTIIIVAALGGHIKDGLTKTSCFISNTNYIEGDTRGTAICQK